MAEYLIPLLKDIFDTKTRMREALSTDNEDFCAYPTLIYNYFIDQFNNNYISKYNDGYNDAYEIILGTAPSQSHTVITRREKRDYTSNLPSVVDYRDSRFVSNMTSIMSEMKLARADMKTELYTTEDRFKIYPDLLNFMILHDTFSQRGYDDGWNEACENLEVVRPLPPTIVYVDNTITIGGKGVIYYSLDGENFLTYYQPIEIEESSLVFSYCVVDSIPSHTINYWCEYGEEEYPRTPLIIFSNYVVTITNREDSGTIYYSTDGENYSVYSSPIIIYEDTTIYAYVVIGADSSSIVSRFCEGNTLYNTPLTFEILSSGTITWSNRFQLDNTYYINDNVVFPISYTINDGETIDVNDNNVTKRYDQVSGDILVTYSFNVNYGDVVRFVGYPENATFEGVVYSNIDLRNYHFETTCRFNVKGNIASMVNYDSNEHNRVFENLFVNCSNLVNANKLILPDSYNRFYRMFRGCSSLITPPEVFPSTTIHSTLQYGGYEETFMDCISLTTAPEILATTLEGIRSCAGMFHGCTSLATAPALPATTLSASCYRDMFSGCTSLKIGPVLPAETLESQCYVDMFWGCSTLEAVKCLALYNINSTNVDGMVTRTGSGVFYCKGIKWGDNMLPSTWDIRFPNQWGNYPPYTPPAPIVEVVNNEVIITCSDTEAVIYFKYENSENYSIYSSPLPVDNGEIYTYSEFNGIKSDIICFRPINNMNIKIERVGNKIVLTSDNTIYYMPYGAGRSYLYSEPILIQTIYYGTSSNLGGYYDSLVGN